MLRRYVRAPSGTSGGVPYFGRLRGPVRHARIGAGMRLDEFLRDFVTAAVAADRRFVRARDAADIEDGIALWEQLAGGEWDGMASEELLVDGYLSVSMLYARRYEARGGGGDLSLALRYLDAARRHVVEGSFADLQVRMSAAAWLLV